MRFLLSVLIMALALINVSHALTFCKDLDINDVPGCKLKCHACQTVSLFGSDTYKVTFTDKSNGFSGPTASDKNSDFAGKSAMVGLFNTDYGCNCYPITIPNTPASYDLGHCSITSKFCFFFASVNDINNKVASYKVVIADTYHRANYEAPMASTEIADVINAFAVASSKFITAPNTALCTVPDDGPVCKSCLAMAQECGDGVGCNSSCLGSWYAQCNAENLAAAQCSSAIPEGRRYTWGPNCGPIP